MKALGVLSMLAASAQADPVQLRANIFAPAGVLALEAGGKTDAVSAETLVWVGDSTGDVLVIAVRGRALHDRVRGTLGRFVATLGAMRPVHVDGASARIRLPRRFDVEAIAGIPVAPEFGAHAWDWVVGGRVARRLGDYGSAGIALLEQREMGRLATEEVGGDLGLALTERSDLATKLAYDLANPGVAEATARATYRRGAIRTEVFGGYRAASHLLPATSLFTVLGDTPSWRAGAIATWRAAPRLDVIAELGIPRIATRATLRLDARGARSITGELRRDDGWTGARVAGRSTLPYALAIVVEAELVKPDGREVVWPWGIVAVRRDVGAWTGALAIEASASPADRYRVDAIAQLGRRWGIP